MKTFQQQQQQQRINEQPQQRRETMRKEGSVTGMGVSMQHRQQSSDHQGGIQRQKSIEVRNFQDYLFSSFLFVAGPISIWSTSFLLWKWNDSESKGLAANSAERSAHSTEEVHRTAKYVRSTFSFEKFLRINSGIEMRTIESTSITDQPKNGKGRL